MQKNEIEVRLTIEQYEFLSRLADDVAFELSGMAKLTPRNKALIQKAEIASSVGEKLKLKASLRPSQV